MQEMNRRSLVKAITWRLVATATTIILVFIFTGEFVLALEVGGLEFVLKFIFFFVHERAWNLTEWGKVQTETN